MYIFRPIRSCFENDDPTIISASGRITELSVRGD